MSFNPAGIPQRIPNRVNLAAGVFSQMDVTDDYTAQNLSARQRDVMKLIVRGLSNKEIASILNLAEGLTAKECLQSAEVCLALAHKTKELDTRAALLAFATSSAPWLSIWSVTSAS